MPDSPAIYPPKADFTAAMTGDVDLPDAPPLTMKLTDTSVGAVSGYAWSFGDGATSSEPSPTHTYDVPGSYVVALTVWNGAGASTTTFRVDFAALDPPLEASSAAEDTLLDLIPSIRAGLLRPSEMKLRLNDIVDVLGDIVRGYSRDLHVSDLEHRTDEADCVLSPLGGSDYLLCIPNVREVEVAQLKFKGGAAFDAYPNQVWYEVGIVPLDYYAERAGRDWLVASTYGGLLLDSGIKVKLSLSPNTVAAAQWRVRYRVPILKTLALSSKTPLPSDFLPMLKSEARLKLLPFMRDSSKEFAVWRRMNEPLMMAQIGEWRRKWEDFLNTTNEPDILPKSSANDWRKGSRRFPRYTIEPRTY